MNNILLTEIYSIGNASQRRYSLRKIYINPDHVMCLREDEVLKSVLREGNLISGMDKRQSFTRVTLNNNSMQQDVLVVGNLDEIYNKLQIETKNLLRG
tara:strand:+ start:7243 stop:7536 length:294 start_codon:yes stop_codon:yes gene_type:complete